MKIVIANTNPIHKRLCASIVDSFEDVVLISEKSELTFEYVASINPDYIFFPHWSFIIPNNIFENYNCVVFHMTDLPFGRGGSPLQNLIERGFTTTKISALKVQSGIDTGDIYMKVDLPLYGTAEEIFIRAGYIIEEMMKEIISKRISPVPQNGEIVEFKRRTASQSNIQSLKSIEQVYDFIRMLDGEGYPKAFIESDDFIFEFSRASLKKDSIIADVRIIKK